MSRNDSEAGDSIALDDAVAARLRELGFRHFGVAAAAALVAEREQLAHFVAEGRHGRMGWLADTAEVRSDPRRFLPEARAVLVVAAPLDASPGPVGFPFDDAGGVARVARYAWGRDYHNALGKRLRKLVRWLRAQGYAARLGVDAQPVMERAWAERAGLGFVGKNACLIVPGIGSHVMLGVVVTDAPLRPSEPTQHRGCGSCTACLDACPTDAFVAARELDARRCLSYLSIEHAEVVDETLRPGFQDWVFGCDLCQDVCPYNQGAGLARVAGAISREFGPQGSAGTRGDARWTIGVDTILRWSEEEYARWAQGSPLARPGRAALARNATYVLGNRGGRRHLPILADVAESDPSPVVRDGAIWAAARVRERER